jgi:hypothetical protein
MRLLPSPCFSQEYGPQASQRVATVLVYLEAPEEGGGWVHMQRSLSKKRGGSTVKTWQVRGKPEEGHRRHPGLAGCIWDAG